MQGPIRNGNANLHANGEANGHVGDHLPEFPGRRRKRKAVIVGAGPVGCLAAIALANKGWSVEVYEGRAGAVCFSSPMTTFAGLHISFPSLHRQAPEKVGRGAAFD